MLARAAAASDHVRGTTLTGPLEIVAAVNRNEVLEQNLLASPDVRSGGALVITERGHRSAGLAYNAGMCKCHGEIVAYVHQDVYLPAGWLCRLRETIARLKADKTPWGLLGVWGVRRDGGFAGRVWCVGGNTEHVAPISGPTEVESVDEIVLIVPRVEGLAFDERLHGFHLYATDAALRAREMGLSTFVFDAPVVHNSRTHWRPVNADYARAYRYMMRKWSRQLPIQTCVMPITRLGLPLWRRRLKQEIRAVRYGPPSPRPPIGPQEIAARLGYESSRLEGAAT